MRPHDGRWHEAAPREESIRTLGGNPGSAVGEDVLVASGPWVDGSGRLRIIVLDDGRPMWHADDGSVRDMSAANVTGWCPTRWLMDRAWLLREHAGQKARISALQARVERLEFRLATSNKGNER